MQDDSCKFTEYFTDPSNYEGVRQNYYNYISKGIVPETETSEEEVPGVENEEGLPPIINGSNFPPQYELTPREFLVDGMFQRGDNILITAPPKLGKSWYWANAAVSIASGTPFLGKATTKSNVMLIDLELRKDTAMDRLISISLAKGFKQVPDQLWLWSLAKHCYDLDTICEVLCSRLADLPQIDLLIVDPLYVIDNGGQFDENNAHCVTRLLTALEKLTVKTGAALGLSHHYRKGNLVSQDAMDRGAGSGAFSRYPDVITSLSNHEIQNCVVVESTTRNMRSPADFVFELDAPLIKERPDLNPAQLRKYGQPGIVEEARNA